MPHSLRIRYGAFLDRLKLWADGHLNFYRVHLLAFTVIPLISAAIFYASNGRTKISYLDSLFMCTSAMTTSGLNTVNLSTITPWQQVILAFLMFIGNSTSISLVVLFVRKSYFKSKCEDAVRMSRIRRHELELGRRAAKANPNPGRFDRIRRRTATIFGFDRPPLSTQEVKEDGLGERTDRLAFPQHVEPGHPGTFERVRRRAATVLPFGRSAPMHASKEDGLSDGQGERMARLRAGTTVSPMWEKDGHGEKKANGSARSPLDMISDANRREPENPYVSGALSPMPTVMETAPTPSPTLPLKLTEVETESPGLDGGDEAQINNLFHDRLGERPQPRPFALGHESDQKLRSPGRHDRLEPSETGHGSRKAPGVRDQNESIEKIEERVDQPSMDSPAELPQDDVSPENSSQYVTSNFSPNQDNFAISPSEVSEFDATLDTPSRPKPDGRSPRFNSLPSPTSRHNTLASPHSRPSPVLHRGSLSPSQRSGTVSSPGSNPTRSPLVRHNFLHPPQPSRRRQTTFREPLHLLHHHGHGHAATGDGHGLGIHSRAHMLRARNGTITSPMIPPFHLEGQSDVASNHGIYPYPHHPHPHAHPLSLKHHPGSEHQSSLGRPPSPGYPPGPGHPPSLGHPPSPGAPASPGYPEHHLPGVQTGQGGLPGPFELLARLLMDYISLVRKFVMDHEREVVTETEGVFGWTKKHHSGGNTGENASEGDNEATLRRDIDDVSLDEDYLERMGGDEYNALVVLSWIVAGYYFLHHAIAFVILAPYSAKVGLVKNVIDEQNANSGRTLNTTWFALFTVISAYANAGLTLVDTSLVEMSNAYLVIFVIIWLILAGATAFPLGLRFFVWLGTKVCRRGSTRKGLKFLLRHPRRCFMYLFPSHQSWYLLFTLVTIFLVDWIAYLTFNIGMPAIEAVPTGPRVVGGFLQAVGQRAGGFTTINLQSIAPALQVVYIATMFVQVYPIAMAVRTSNVYEDSGVVIYEQEENEAEPTNLPSGRGAGFRAYVGWHLKHQLAQDLFWLIAALTALCAFERSRILDESTSYFNIFSLFFEIVSAFANVGFSLGVATQPFSLSGEFRTIPKLIIMGLMIRGRHRGLPMAIDRAVQLPTEYKTTSHVVRGSNMSSPRSAGMTMSRRQTVGTYSRTSIRQRQRAQDPTLSSDEDE